MAAEQRAPGKADSVSPSVVADLAYVENLIVSNTVLQGTRHRVALVDGKVSVEVQGSHWEARAWRNAIAGRIFPSHVDVHGVRRQLVVGARVGVQVVEHLVSPVLSSPLSGDNCA